MVQQSLVLCVSLLISPNPSLLMASLQHETWHIIHYSVHAPCYLSPAPYGLCCLQTPKSLSLGHGLFLWEPLHRSLFLRGNGVTMMSDHRHSRLLASKSDRMFNNWPYNCCAGPIANSSNLTFWRQQLWVIKGLRGLTGKKKNIQPHTHIKNIQYQMLLSTSLCTSLKHNLL